MHNLSKLISNGENENLEFKESLRSEEEIGQTVSAFSNWSGGLILGGVSDSGTIPGVAIGGNTLEQLASYLKTNTDPAIFPSMKIVDIDGKKILVIEVKESSDKPVFFKNHAYKRVGKTNQRIFSSEMRKLVRESSKRVYWDELICEEAKLEEISEEKVKRFLKQAKLERNFGVDPDIPVIESLEKLKLVKDGKTTKGDKRSYR